eukprot:6491909-Amphidinium_carterae.4
MGCKYFSALVGHHNSRSGSTSSTAVVRKFHGVYGHTCLASRSFLHFLNLVLPGHQSHEERKLRWHL